MIVRNAIVGPTTIPQFNGNPKPINLKDYEGEDMPVIDGYEFMYIMAMYIGGYDKESEEYKRLRQYTIRFLDASEDAQEEMQDSFERNNWNTKEGAPPCWTLNENDEPDLDGAIDGRRRVGGAIETGQSYIPLAIYRKNDNLTDLEGYKRRLEAAQKLNNKTSSRRYNTKNDYIMTGIELVNKNCIGSDMPSILNWLKEDMNYEERFLKANTQAEIANKIYELANADYSIVAQMTEPLANAWVKEKNILKKKNGKWDTSIKIVCVDDPRYADRLIADFVIPSVLAKKRTDPVNIIFYSKKRKPVDVKKNIKRFGDALDTSYENIFKFVQVMMNNAFSCNIPEYKPYKIMGCIPQLQDEQDVEGDELISYDVVTKNVKTS